jgi:transcription elongation factor GreB
LSPLPPGAKNYLTASGAQRLRDELNQLEQVRRPGAGTSTDEEDLRQFHAAEERIEYLRESLHTATVVPPPAVPEEVVRFGATVTVRERSGEETRYRIVGVDETDVDRDWISWLSPIARALLNARLGQRVRIRLPGGEKELEIVGIIYE